MSLIGKKPIEIPVNVQVKMDDGVFFAKGPLGELSRKFGEEINIDLQDKQIILKNKEDTKKNISLWGTYASHIRNMIEGVTKGFEKKLQLEGVGYKVQLEGTKLNFSLGFSHPVKIDIPEGLKVTTEKNLITVSGIDKEKVGSFSAKIKLLKKPEPYKGKGIRYENEIIRRKAGKKAATSGA